MTCSVASIRKEPIFSCLQCPLCCNLVREATTISECLHTFCRSCIHQELSDGENDCCPICNVSLGGTPLEKLRPDHQLNDVCAKIFPLTAKKRKKEYIADVDNEAPEPVRVKERSLSSLGIGVALSSAPGFVRRKTKSVSRRSTVKDTSSDDESEGNKTDRVTPRKVSGKDSNEESTSDAKSINAESEESDEAFSHEEDEEEVQQVVSKRKVTQSTREKVQVKRAPRTSKSSVWSNNGTKSLGMREKLNKDLINQSLLAHLAEVAADQAGYKDSFDPPRGPRAPRGRDRKEVSRPFIMGGSLCWKMMIEHIRGTVLPQEKKHKPTTPTVVDMAPATPIKPPVSKSSSPADKKPSNPSISQKRANQNMGFWFSLEAANNQLGECPLPQISMRYVRTKDGKLPVSSLKKYLVKKLNLQSEAEVEITCRGQQLVSNLPLEKVRGIWMATTPSSSELLPALKAINTASHDETNWIKFKGKSAEECMMVLTYSRQHNRIAGF